MNFKTRTILHSDVNNFFASCECAMNPTLSGKPIAVIGNPQKRSGIILAKNMLAKSFGVQTGEAIWQAKLKCPDLVCLSPHYEKYEEISKKIIEIYKEYTDKIESFGIDECWLDVTNSLSIFGSGEKIANEIREKIKSRIGVTASVGVSFCKLFAKLGSDLKKPDATTTISKENYKKIIYPLPVNSIVGIGWRLEKRLNHLGIFTLGQLAQTNKDILKKKFGIIGEQLKEKLSGNDVDEVQSIHTYRPPKSIGNGTTTIRDIQTREEIEKVVTYLSEHVAHRLRSKNLVGGTLGISIKDNKLHWAHKERKLPFLTNDAVEIITESMQIIKDFWDFQTPVRAIRVCITGLKSEEFGKQLSIFNMKEQRKAKLNSGIDKVTNKYGNNSINLSNYMNCDFINYRLIEE